MVPKVPIVNVSKMNQALFFIYVETNFLSFFFLVVVFSFPFSGIKSSAAHLNKFQETKNIVWTSTIIIYV